LSTTAAFQALLTAHGSAVVFHRDDSTTPCPCQTPEGFRDPEWHVAHPTDPVCNAKGMLPSAIEFGVKAFIQPAQSTRATRLTSEYIQELFGTVRADDHIGIFPVIWNGQVLNFDDWSQDGEDYIAYNGEKFFIVNINILPDPSDGNPNHHVEAGLRVLRG
jgi:hypothetical protein